MISKIYPKQIFFMFIVVVSAILSYFVGEFNGSQSIRNNRFVDETIAFKNSLRENNIKSKIDIQMTTYDGSISISGEVYSEQDLAKLKEALRKLFGDYKSDYFLSRINVSEE